MIGYYHPQKGYVGKKMSVRAMEAYDDGEMPKSKWTKSKILEGLEDYLSPQELERIKGVSSQVLKDECLVYSSWHHTGSFYNQTDFYEVRKEIDIDYILKCDKEYKENKPKVKKEKDTFEYCLVTFEESWKDGRWWKSKRYTLPAIVKNGKTAYLNEWTKLSNGTKRRFDIVKKLKKDDVYKEIKSKL